MLVKLYRNGPVPQRLLKGYVIAGRDSAALLQSIPEPAGLVFRRDPKQPMVLWLDTGLCWLHNHRARRSWAEHLTEGVRSVGTWVAARGGRLLPSATRTSAAVPWDGFLCGDDHLLACSEPGEAACFSNLIREWLPTLIAWTGRAGVSPNDISSVGSQRLAASSHHHPAVHWDSLSPAHLRRTMRTLKRERGIEQLEDLDVHPEPTASSAGPTLVRLRFTDAAAFVSTALAHSILYQALFLRSRREYRRGARIEPMSQSHLDIARSRAIAQGLRATVRRESSLPTGTPFTAQSCALELLDLLAPELVSLDVEFEEITPLAGVVLRSLGLPAAAQETDVFRAMRAGRPRTGTSAVEEIAGVVAEQPTRDPIHALNARRFPQAADDLGLWWRNALGNASATSASDPQRSPRTAAGPVG